MDNIQWFPGHMAKAKRLILENLHIVDVIIEVLDARIPLSSHNTDVEKILNNKPRVLVLNKSDLADPQITRKWHEYYKKQGIAATFLNSHDSKTLGEFKNIVKGIMSENNRRLQEKGILNRPVKTMVVGIPNSGKSSFINALAGRASARTGDIPGVTRGKQWIRIESIMDLLDMPGVLQPKFENQKQALNLAFTGAIKDDTLDVQDLASALLEKLRDTFPGLISARYKLTGIEEMTGYEMLEMCAKNRGFILTGGIKDINRMASVLMDEFRGGKIGRITLETPNEGNPI